MGNKVSRILQKLLGHNEGQRAARLLPTMLEEIIDGTTAKASIGSSYFLISKSAVALEAQATALYKRFASLTGHPNELAVEPIATICRHERIAPREIVFLDLETTGLDGTPLFLIGTMECEDDGFYFRQYFARDYSEEASILAAASERLADASLLVTFNGKSFDVPYMQKRCAVTGVKLRLPQYHLDILHEARRLYRGKLPNCRLQTLEQMICGRYRDDDVPSSEIPAIYHEFLRTGDATKIKLVLAHNLYDLFTMADLMNRMWDTKAIQTSKKSQER